MYIYYLNFHYVLIYVKDIHLNAKIVRIQVTFIRVQVQSELQNPDCLSIGFFCEDHISETVFVVHNIHKPL